MTELPFNFPDEERRAIADLFRTELDMTMQEAVSLTWKVITTVREVRKQDTRTTSGF